MAIELEVKLKDGVSVPAGSAAHQVDVLTRQLRSLQTAMIKANAAGDDKALQRQAEKYQKISGAVDSLRKRKELIDSAAKKSPLESKTRAEVEATMRGITATESLSMAMASLASAAAVAAVAIAALGVGFGKLSKYAYDAAAGHNVLLAQLDALGGGAVQGEKVVDMARKLATVLPLTTKEIAGMAKEMMQAGIRDLPRLEQATKAIAASAAMVGDEGGKAMQSLVVDLHAAAQSASGISDLSGRLKSLGLTTEEIAKAAGFAAKTPLQARYALDAMASTAPGVQKLGAIIQDFAIRKGATSMRELAATVGKMAEKLGDNIAQLFTRIGKTEGFKSFAIELQRFAQLFGLMNASGKSAENGIVSAFDSIFAVASKVMKAISLAILDFQIAINDVRIAMLPFQDRFDKLGDKLKEMLPDWQQLSTILTGIGVVIVAITAGVAGMVATLMAGVVVLTTGLAWVVGKMTQLGTDIVKGISEGIRKGADELKQTWNLMVGGLPKVLADKLQIRSPSRVMMRLGLALPQGLEQGIEKGTPDAAGAAARMAMGAAGGGAVGVATAAREGRGGGVVVNLAPGAIQVAGSNGESQTTLVEEAIVSMFERIALTQGVA